VPKGQTKYRRGQRERRILEALARGETNPQIARAMGLTFSTIRSYVSELFAELEAPNRVAVVFIAIERGLIPGPERRPPLRALAPMRRRQNG
jgi:DNA-binding NarL/FixJ family response regulator